MAYASITKSSGGQGAFTGAEQQAFMRKPSKSSSIFSSNLSKAVWNQYKKSQPGYTAPAPRASTNYSGSGTFSNTSTFSRTVQRRPQAAKPQTDYAKKAAEALARAKYASNPSPANKANMAQYLTAAREQDSGRNKQIQETLLRQRQQQAKLMQQARDRLQTAGNRQKTKAAKASQKLEARGKQNLISRGLHNTTITSGFERSVGSDLADTNAGIQEGVDSRIASTYEREAGMQIPEANTQLGGISQQTGGLADYIKLISMMQGGLG